MDLKDQRIKSLRPDKGSFRPDSRPKLVRLLRTVLRQPVGVFLLALALGLFAGCSAEVHVTTEKTAPRIDAAEAAQPATKQRTQTAVAVSLLNERKPSPAVERSPAKEPAAAPPPEPRRPVEIVGNGNSVTVVEGDLHVHQHVHVHEAPSSERFEIDIHRYEPERDEECERLHRQYQEKVRQLRRMFHQ